MLRCCPLSFGCLDIVAEIGADCLRSRSAAGGTSCHVYERNDNKIGKKFNAIAYFLYWSSRSTQHIAKGYPYRWI
jgi:hypothetical protein